MLDPLRLAFQTLPFGHFLPEGGRPGRDLLLQRRVEVLQRLVPRLQLGQERGLRSERAVLGVVQRPQFVLAAARPQGHLERTQQGARGERALQHGDVAHRAQPLHALPQGAVVKRLGRSGIRVAGVDLADALAPAYQAFGSLAGDRAR